MIGVDMVASVSRANATKSSTARGVAGRNILKIVALQAGNESK